MVAFILVAVPSDGRLFNAIIRRSIVKQRRRSLAPVSSTLLVSFAIVSSRSYRFEVCSFDWLVAAPYGMKSSRRPEEEEEKSVARLTVLTEVILLPGIYEQPGRPINR